MFKYALVALATAASLATPALAKDKKVDADVALAAQLSTNSAFAAQLNSNPNPMMIADTVNTDKSLAPLSSVAPGMDSSNQMTIRKAGAAFVKVHFSYFNLPEGAYVTVSDPQGKENYRYDGNNHKTATFNSQAGENGVTQFSAMSVFGDTAIVSLMMPQGAVWQAQHGIRVDRFNAGTSEELLAEQQQAQLSTCGINERRDVACWQSTHPVEYERTRPVARLLMSGSGLCTGWRVGNDNRMFTNNHCVDNQSTLANTEVWFNYQHTSCGGSTFSGTIKVTGNSLLKTDYDLDYTLFTVNDFANIAEFGNFGLETRTPSLGELIYIAQHGAGNPKELAIESDQNSNGLCQIDVQTADGRGTGTDTGYYCDTIGGSSGSPVIAGSSNKVIALHHFGGCTNQGVRMDQIWPQVSTHFGGVVPQGDAGTPSEQPPVAQIDANCTLLNCSFDGSGSVDADGSIVSYAWDLDDNTTANGSSASHIYSASGSYTVSLTVTDNDGLSGTATETVTVSDGAGNVLVSAVPVNNIAGATGSDVLYTMDIPENDTDVVVNMSGGTGDADLFVKKDAIPSSGDYDCRPYSAGNNENCEVSFGTPGTLYVNINAYSAYSGVSLVATASTGPVDPPSDFPKTDLSAATGDWEHFTYTASAGSITVTMSDGTGDADLYTRKGAEPTTSDYDCRPYSAGNSESCTVTGLTSGDVVYIGLRAYSAYTGVSVDVN